jgi:hypothetical protein
VALVSFQILAIAMFDQDQLVIFHASVKVCKWLFHVIHHLLTFVVNRYVVSEFCMACIRFLNCDFEKIH